MFVLEHKEGEERIIDVTNSVSYDLSVYVHLSISLQPFHQDQLIRTELLNPTMEGL